jgi:PAS domain-containing protein
MRFLFQDAPIHISVLEGPDHRFVAMNGAYRASSPGPSAVGLPYIEVFPERSDGLALLDEAYRTERPVTRADVPRRFVRRPGGQPEEGFISLVIQPLPDAGGKTAGLAVFSIDVTDTVRARQRLAELERDQFALLDLLATGVVVIDEGGYLVKANAAARSLLSLPVAPVRLTPDLASRYQVRDATDDRAITFDEIPTVRAMRGEPCADPYLYRVRDPELQRDRLLRVSAMPLLRDDGSLRGSVTTFSGA